MEGISEISRDNLFNIPPIGDVAQQVDIGSLGSKVVSYCKAHPVLLIGLAIILVAAVIFCAYNCLYASKTNDISGKIEVNRDQSNKPKDDPKIQEQQEGLERAQKEEIEKAKQETAKAEQEAAEAEKAKQEIANQAFQDLQKRAATNQLTQKEKTSKNRQLSAVKKLAKTMTAEDLVLAHPLFTLAEIQKMQTA